MFCDKFVSVTGKYDPEESGIRAGRDVPGLKIAGAERLRIAHI
jgi:hypothetical protein